VKSKRSRLALVDHCAPGRNQVQTVWPSCVGGFHLIVEAVDHSWKLDAKLSYAGIRNRRPFNFVAWAAKEHLVADVALHFPHICRVSFQDINGVKIDLAFVLLRQFIQGGNLPPKGRSSVAAEDEDDWLLCPKRGEL